MLFARRLAFFLQLSVASQSPTERTKQEGAVTRSCPQAMGSSRLGALISVFWAVWFAALLPLLAQDAFDYRNFP